MPKRARTPPPPDDEPRFLTVVHPYPANANMELEQDRAECSRWLASCTGKEVLCAMYHKPTAPNAIIIEVMRDFGDWKRLLGEHRWSEVFKKCDPSVEDWVSQVFWCQFTSGREVQKHGWKRIDIRESWFRGWAIPNKLVASPYPATHWCKVSQMDKTNAPLCRPLPTASFPRPTQSVRPPPVGPEEWHRQRDMRIPDAKSAWGKGPPVMIPNPPTTSSAHTLSRGASDSNGSMPLPAGSGHSVPYQGGLPPVNMPYASNANSWGRPPGLSHVNSAQSVVDDGWDDDEIIGVTPAVSVISDVFVAGDRLEDALAGLSIKSTSCGDDDSDDDMPGVPAAEVFDEPSYEPEDNLWAGYQETNVELSRDEIICPAHGKLCSRGICKEYGALKRGRERAAEAERKAQELVAKRQERKLKGNNDAPSPRDKVSYTAPQPKPPHLAKVVPARDAEDPATSPTSSPVSASASTPASVAAAGPSSTPVRSKPAHLMKSASANNAEASSNGARPARGRKMNSASTTPPVAHPPPPRENDTPARTEKLTDGWGYVPRDPWGGSSIHASEASGPTSPAVTRGGVNRGGGAMRGRGGGAGGRGRGWTQPPPPAARADTRSVASRSSDGWGHIPRDPWGGQSVGVPSGKDDNSDAATEKGSVKGVKKSWADQMDDADNKSVASSASGWGHISNGPWGG